jgi:hypothetical protein
VLPDLRKSATARGTILVSGIAALTLALTGCSQLSDIVDQVLPERGGAHILAVGECFNNTVAIVTGEDVIVDVPRENCTLAHDNEVFAAQLLTGKSFPGDERIAEDASSVCLGEFEDFIGVGIAEAGTLQYDFFAPTENTWALGDREILCFAFDTAAQTAYTLRDQGSIRAAEASTEPLPEGES